MAQHISTFIAEYMSNNRVKQEQAYFNRSTFETLYAILTNEIDAYSAGEISDPEKSIDSMAITVGKLMRLNENLLLDRITELKKTHNPDTLLYIDDLLAVGREDRADDPTYHSNF